MLEGQGSQSVREGKDDMDGGRREHLALPSREPRGVGGAMACGTAAVPARVVRLGLVPAMVALGNMAAESGSPAQRESSQGSLLLA